MKAEHVSGKDSLERLPAFSYHRMVLLGDLDHVASGNGHTKHQIVQVPCLGEGFVTQPQTMRHRIEDFLEKIR